VVLLKQTDVHEDGWGNYRNAVQENEGHNPNQIQGNLLAPSFVFYLGCEIGSRRCDSSIHGRQLVL